MIWLWDCCSVWLRCKYLSIQLHFRYPKSIFISSYSRFYWRYQICYTFPDSYSVHIIIICLVITAAADIEKGFRRRRHNQLNPLTSLREIVRRLTLKSILYYQIYHINTKYFNSNSRYPNNNDNLEIIQHNSTLSITHSHVIMMVNHKYSEKLSLPPSQTSINFYIFIYPVPATSMELRTLLLLISFKQLPNMPLIIITQQHSRISNKPNHYSDT